MSSSFHFGLIGENISYSKSKEIFEAIFEQNNISGKFSIFDISASVLESKLQEIKKSHIDGFSVTIPHKNNILGYLDEIDSIARNIGAVNSVKVSGEKLIGHNTDAIGFRYGLNLLDNVSSDYQAMILGCGGASKAVVYSLYHDFHIRNFIVIGRNSTKLKTFKEYCEINYNDTKIVALLDSEFDSVKSDLDKFLVVNCTPLAGANHPDQLPLPDKFKFWENDFYYDLNYNKNNKMVEIARESIKNVIDGSFMLLAQAIESLNIWTENKNNIDVGKLHKQIFPNNYHEYIKL